MSTTNMFVLSPPLCLVTGGAGAPASTFQTSRSRPSEQHRGPEPSTAMTGAAAAAAASGAAAQNGLAHDPREQRMGLEGMGGEEGGEEQAGAGGDIGGGAGRGLSVAAAAGGGGDGVDMAHVAALRANLYRQIPGAEEGQEPPPAAAAPGSGGQAGYREEQQERLQQQQRQPQSEMSGTAGGRGRGAAGGRMVSDQQLRDG